MVRTILMHLIAAIKMTVGLSLIENKLIYTYE